MEARQMADPQPVSVRSDERKGREERPRRERAPKADRLGRGGSRSALQRLREALRTGLDRPLTDDTAPLDWDAADAGEELTGTPPDLRDPAVDGLPEHTLYRDDGCHVAPACLACPLPACIFDRRHSPLQQARRRRNGQIRSLTSKGWSSARLAERFALSQAQVRRIRAARRR